MSEIVWAEDGQVDGDLQNVVAEMGGGGGGIAADKLHRSNKTRKSTEIKCNLNSLEIKLRKAVEGKRQ